MSSLEPDQNNPLDDAALSADDTMHAKGSSEESERWLRAAVQNSSDIVMILEADATIRYASPAVERVLGYRPEDFVGTIALDYVHPEDLEYMSKSFAETLEKPGVQPPIEYRVRRADGSWRHMEAIRSNWLEDPNVAGVVANVRDITERKEAEEALKESEQRLRTIIGNVPVILFATDQEGVFTLSEGKGLEILGLLPSEVVGRSVFEVYRDVPEILEPARRTLDGEEVSTTMEVGGLFFESYYRPLRDESGGVIGLIGVAANVTEHKRAEKRLRYQATHDLLTDLPNRHLFVDRLERALRLTRRTTGRKVAVLYLDLDNFKVVNDSLGHEMGDLLLVAAGERVRWCLRPEDTLARLGGDEFAVLLEEVEAPSDAAKVAKRILERFRAPFVLEGREFVIKPSIGIALGTARQKTAEELLRDADTAMYQVKGRDDHYEVFDPAMYEQALRRLKLEGDLRRAIDDEEFVVCYQPIVNLETGEASGVEALVRWEHPEQQGLLAPSQFIPVAEEASLVVPMGRWVLEEACRQGAKWQQEHPHIPPLVVSVNLSAKQLQHPDVAEMVEETLKETGFDARCLSLDITETLYIEALEGNTAALDKLKKMGVSISIDDFGTGYSSLAYLKRLPAETLKIDKSFIKGIGEDLEDTAIVQMIIELAHTLGMEIIAEGVESEEQAEQLKEMGCDLGQGYHFAKPLPPEAVPDFLIR